jgi:hypothetical protein
MASERTVWCACAQASIAAVSSCEILTALTASRPARTVWTELLLLALDTLDIRPAAGPIEKNYALFTFSDLTPIKEGGRRPISAMTRSCSVSALE